MFELPETLNGELTDVLINSMSVLMSPRIRAVPMETDIVIEDTDGACLCVCMYAWVHACVCVSGY